MNGFQSLLPTSYDDDFGPGSRPEKAAAPELIPLSRLTVELSDLTGATPPTYRKLNTLVLDGVIRTEIIGQRHFVRREDLQAIAIKLGMLTP
jgi:hypothetical protein